MAARRPVMWKSAADLKVEQKRERETEILKKG